MTADDKTRLSPRMTTTRVGMQLSGIYELDERIGSGGMGEVYRGHNIQTGDPVAIKIVLPEFARDQTILSLFRKEASILNHLSHDAVVRYHLFTVEPTIGRPYLAMEFVDGVPLCDVMRRGGMPVADVRMLCRRLASGLSAVHRAGAIHRDLSPDNIILPEGRVERAKIIDFGIARSASVGGETLIGGQFAGKYNYVSPEQLGLYGGDVCEPSDIYSLGLVLAAALRGKPLDMAGSQVEVVEKRRSVPDLSGIAADFRGMIEAMLQPDPRNRPASMADIVRLMREETLTDGEQAGRPASATPHAGRNAGSARKRAIVAALLGSLVAATAAGLYLRGLTPSPLPHKPSPTLEAAKTPPADGHGKGAAGEPAAVSSAQPQKETDTAPAGLRPEGAAGSKPGTADIPSPAEKTPASTAVRPDGGTALKPTQPTDEAAPPAGTVTATAPPRPESREPARLPASRADTPALQAPANAGNAANDGNERAARPSNPPAGPVVVLNPPRPPEPPANAVDEVAQRISWLHDYPGGDCFYATVTSATDNAVAIEGFGTDARPFQQLLADFQRRFHVEPDISVRLIEPAQCEVTRFLRTIGAAGAESPRLTLDRTSIPDGSPISGTLVTHAGLVSSLLLIDHKGVAFNLDNRVVVQPDRVVFSIPASLGAADKAANKAMPQILMVITGPRDIQAASFSSPIPAAVLLPKIMAEIAADKAAFAATAKYLRLGG